MGIGEGAVVAVSMWGFGLIRTDLSLSIRLHQAEEYDFTSLDGVGLSHKYKPLWISDQRNCRLRFPTVPDLSLSTSAFRMMGMRRLQGAGGPMAESMTTACPSRKDWLSSLLTANGIS